MAYEMTAQKGLNLNDINFVIKVEKIYEKVKKAIDNKDTNKIVYPLLQLVLVHSSELFIVPIESILRIFSAFEKKLMSFWRLYRSIINKIDRRLFPIDSSHLQRKCGKHMICEVFA